MLQAFVRRAVAAWRVASFTAILLSLAIAKRVVPLRVLVRLAWRPTTQSASPQDRHELLSRVLQADRLIALPDRSCLQRSLLIYRVLSRLGADPVLQVGFKSTPDGVVGHAWVTCDGRPVVERSAELRTLKPTVAFGRHGRPLAPVAGQ
jgi:hypothetical protein